MYDAYVHPNPRLSFSFLFVTGLVDIVYVVRLSHHIHYMYIMEPLSGVSSGAAYRAQEAAPLWEPCITGGWDRNKYAWLAI